MVLFSWKPSIWSTNNPELNPYLVKMMHTFFQLPLRFSVLQEFVHKSRSQIKRGPTQPRRFHQIKPLGELITGHIDAAAAQIWIATARDQLNLIGGLKTNNTHA